MTTYHSRVDETLLLRGNTLLLLDAFLDALHRIVRLDIDLDFLARQCLHLQEGEDGGSGGASGEVRVWVWVRGSGGGEAR